MFLYTVIEAIVAVVAGILIAKRTNKEDGLSSNIKIDKIGKITNIILLVVYVVASPFYLFLGMISTTDYKGFLGIVGWIVAIIIASAALFCGLGLGFSVALRKKGKSKESFIVQFTGLFGIILTFSLFMIFYGNLLSNINF